MEKPVPVVLEWAGEAREVGVAGDFTSWEVVALHLEGSVWRAVIQVAPPPPSTSWPTLLLTAAATSPITLVVWNAGKLCRMRKKIQLMFFFPSVFPNASA